MIPNDICACAPLLSGDTVLRAQENAVYGMLLIDGKPAEERDERTGGVSALTRRGHFLGFAAVPGWERADIGRALARAEANAKAGTPGAPLSPPAPVVCPEPAAPDEASRAGKLAVLRELDGYLAAHCPKVKSRSLSFEQFSCEKRLLHPCGTNAHTRYERCHIIVSLTGDGPNGDVSVETSLGGSGRFTEIFADLQPMRERLERLYAALCQKGSGIVPRAGRHICILAPDPGALLVHEAVGHTVEADLVMGGSVAGRCLGQPMASELITVGDFAREMAGTPVPQPIWLDDECAPARDAVLIRGGVMTGFMHDRDSAEHWGVPDTGNARAFTYALPPILRMRNTAILPGASTTEELISSVDDGYYLVRAGMGQADVTGEFMIQIIEGYEIRGGRLGAAICDTVCSGRTFEVLKSVDMVGNTVSWDSAGLCGKGGQPMTTAAGSPALRCVLNIGGK